MLKNSQSCITHTVAGLAALRLLQVFPGIMSYVPEIVQVSRIRVVLVILVWGVEAGNIAICGNLLQNKAFLEPCEYFIRLFVLRGESIPPGSVYYHRIGLGL
jgi:hypothetical protein